MLTSSFFQSLFCYFKFWACITFFPIFIFFFIENLPEISRSKKTYKFELLDENNSFLFSSSSWSPSSSRGLAMVLVKLHRKDCSCRMHVLRVYWAYSILLNKSPGLISCALSSSTWPERHYLTSGFIEKWVFLLQFNLNKVNLLKRVRRYIWRIWRMR